MLWAWLEVVLIPEFSFNRINRFHQPGTFTEALPLLQCQEVSTCVGNALDSYNSDAQACANALNTVSGRVQNLIDGYQSLENPLSKLLTLLLSHI
ncbi:MAG: hypothetical protein ACLUTU_13275 [Blautia faecis]